jgi:threonine aldolase
MNFASDNTGPAHPRIVEAVLAANAGYAPPYGADPVTEDAVAAVRDLFEAPEAFVGFVPTGSAANALALACLVKPWDAVFCHRLAHIEEDECGAPEFYSGAKSVLVEGPDGKMEPGALKAAIATAADRGIHGVQPGAVSLTNVTERGTVHDLDEIAALVGIAKAHGLPVHLDGARFANACAALGCSPAEMSWKAGVDAVSFGGTKNGCMGVEAVILFDPARAREFELRRKRGGHLFSKQRYLSAQMGAYCRDGLWREMAQAANARMARLVAGLETVPGARLLHPAEANMAFLHLPRAAHARAFEGGALYGVSPSDAMQPGAAANAPVACRVVCDWAKPEAEIAALLELWRGQPAAAP